MVLYNGSKAFQNGTLSNGTVCNGTFGNGTLDNGTLDNGTFWDDDFGFNNPFDIVQFRVVFITLYAIVFTLCITGTLIHILN